MSMALLSPNSLFYNLLYEGFLENKGVFLGNVLLFAENIGEFLENIGAFFGKQGSCIQTSVGCSSFLTPIGLWGHSPSSHARAYARITKSFMLFAVTAVTHFPKPLQNNKLQTL